MQKFKKGIGRQVRCEGSPTKKLYMSWPMRRFAVQKNTIRRTVKFWAISNNASSCLEMSVSTCFSSYWFHTADALFIIYRRRLLHTYTRCLATALQLHVIFIVLLRYNSAHHTCAEGVGQTFFCEPHSRCEPPNQMRTPIFFDTSLIFCLWKMPFVNWFRSKMLSLLLGPVNIRPTAVLIDAAD